MKLKYTEDAQPASKVTVHYDNKIRNLTVDEDNCVTVENKMEARELQESHGSFEIVEGSESDLPDHVLADKNVGEVEKYVRDIEDIDRLKELREKEDRKTAINHIDDRIAEVQENSPTDADYEEVDETEEESEEGKSDESEEDNQEDGEETEDE